MVDNIGSILSSVAARRSIKKLSSALSYHYIQEAVAAGALELQHDHSNKNLADIFTTALDSDFFIRHPTRLLNEFRPWRNGGVSNTVFVDW